ncbi:MAG: PAS domain-containing protein [Campylobacterota bacterium]|nr:PAS domain-containing protein [Campylobacterota bacterium]
MKKNKSIILLFVGLFIVLSLFSIVILEKNAKSKIEIVLEKHNENLEKHYKILTNQNQKSADATFDALLDMSGGKVLELFSKASMTKDLNKLENIREELYNLLKKRYELMKKRGMYQFHFIFADNRSFLRMHKPSKWGDDLSFVRKDFVYVNKNKKILRGFSQGKTSHGFSNIYPVYDKNKRYIGAIDLAYPSELFQNNLTEIDGIHSHFLVNKYIFNVKQWDRLDFKDNYLQSAEHKDYLITITKEHSPHRCIDQNIKKLAPYEEFINNNIAKGDKFNLYVDNNGIYQVLSFYPIEESVNKKVSAWIVTYMNSIEVGEILEILLLLEILVVFIFFIILVMIYFLINEKNILQELVEERTKDLKRLNDTLEEKISLRTKELEDKNKLFNEAEKIAKLGFWSINIKENKLYWSDEMYNIYLQDKNKIEPSYELFINSVDPKDIENVKEIYKRSLETKEPYTIVHKLLLSEGTVKYVKEVCSTIFDDKSGEPLITNGTVQDITQQYMQEKVLAAKDKQLIEQSKLISMSDLLQNIAHQYRQPLSTISTSASGLIVKSEYGLLNDEELIESCNLITQLSGLKSN